MKQELLYPKLSYKITGLCFKTHNKLGRFAKEKQYGDRLEQLLRGENLKYQREAKIEFKSSDSSNDSVSGNIADFIIEARSLLSAKQRSL